MRHRTRPLTLASLVVALAASAAVVPALAAPADAAPGKAPAVAAKAAAPSAGAPHDAPTAGTSGKAAQKAYVDPKTGQFVSTPPPGTAAPSREALAPADARLPEIPNQTRAGGVRAKVPAYLVQTLTATVQPDGSVAMRCADGPAPAPATAPAAGKSTKEEARRER